MYRSVGRTIGKILMALLIIAILLGVVYLVLDKYTIKTVYVEGNVHYTEDEIKSIVMDGALGNNSLYLSLKYANRDVENIPFVDVMNVSILSPDTIKITVYEKALVGYVKYLDSYMYFDKDGYVVESSAVKTLSVPQVTGLTFDYMVLGEPLPVEDSTVFNRILDITNLLNKYILYSDKIYFHASGDVTVYFGSVKVALGNEPGRMEDKIALLPGYFEELQKSDIKSGTLHMEKFVAGKGRYRFKPD